MRKNQKQKTMAIVALCVSVLGLTLGFAAFSNTLTISSSATVKPNSKDFKLVLYGLPKAYDVNSIDKTNPESLNVNLFTSKTSAAPIATLNSEHSGEIATLDNETLTISNMKANFTTPSYPQVEYIYVMKNEGEYDAYANVFDFSYPNRTCTPGEGTSESLVDAACEGITFEFYLGHVDEQTDKISWRTEDIMDSNGNIKLEKGKYWYIRIILTYESGAARADGPFSVKWDDVKINLSTASK